MSKQENDINDLFKKSFDNFEAKVKPSVWKNIKVALKWGGVGVLVKFILSKFGSNTIVAVISSAATVVSTVMVMNWSKTDLPEIAANEKLTEKVEELHPNPLPEVKTQPMAVIEKESIETIPANVVEPEVLKADPEPLVKTKTVTEVAEPSKKEKQKIESVITSYSGLSIAAISASPVGGSVPLIVNLENTGVGTHNKWLFSDGKKANVGANPIHVFEQPGIYTVTLISTNEQGVQSTDSIKIEVTGNSSISAIPTLFSPNGDGNADIFTFKSKNMVNMKVEIFDKTGTIFYKWSGDDGSGQWDGTTSKGKKAKEGTYFYLIEAEGVDGKKYEQKGAINLAR